MCSGIKAISVTEQLFVVELKKLGMTFGFPQSSENPGRVLHRKDLWASGLPSDKCPGQTGDIHGGFENGKEK